MGQMSKAYIKKRLIHFMDQRMEAIDQIKECRYDWVYECQMRRLSELDWEVNRLKRLWDNYGDPQPWKGDGRYVCHVDIPEEYEA